MSQKEKVLPTGNQTLEEVERRHIISALKKTGGKISGEDGAAAILGLHPNTLRFRMQKLGVTRATYQN